jgi:hypothetical protein
VETAPPAGQNGGSAGGSGIGVGGGATGGTGVTAPDPFATAPTCTSGTTWTQGNHGSDDMNRAAHASPATAWGTALR